MWKHVVPVALVALACHREAPPALVPSSSISADPRLAQPTTPPRELARGTYVATIAGCIVCHGGAAADNSTMTVSGGIAGPLGGGVWRAPNLTPDRETGLGGWSDTQVAQAIRVGLRAERPRLLPIMPYPYYHRMTDDDVRAVVTFLRAQPPVKNDVERSEGLPLAPVELTEPVGNVDRVDDPAAHGEYLANLMHCGACHTPQSGPLAGKPLAGGTKFQLDTGTIIAPNLTSDRDTGIGTWTADDIVRAVKRMTLPNGQPIGPPMSNYRDAWAQLTDADARALASYILEVPPVHNDTDAHQHEVTIAP